MSTNRCRTQGSPGPRRTLPSARQRSSTRSWSCWANDTARFLRMASWSAYGRTGSESWWTSRSRCPGNSWRRILSWRNRSRRSPRSGRTLTELATASCPSNPRQNRFPSNLTMTSPLTKRRASNRVTDVAADRGATCRSASPTSCESSLRPQRPSWGFHSTADLFDRKPPLVVSELHGRGAAARTA